MVERWSSKSFMWVRFLLLLITNFFSINKPPYKNFLTHQPILTTSINSSHEQLTTFTARFSVPSSWPLLPPFSDPIIHPISLRLESTLQNPYQIFLTPPHEHHPALFNNKITPIHSPEQSTNLSPHPLFKVAPPLWYLLMCEKRAHPPLDLPLTPLFARGLISAIEYIANTKICLRVDFFARQHLTPEDLTKLMFWQSRLYNFQRLFRGTLFLKDSLLAFYFALRFHDLPMMIRWLRRAFTKINFWRYRSFLYFIRYTFRYVLIHLYRELGVMGIRFRLKGKISVAGNARTRTIEHTIGAVKSTSKDFGVLHEMTTINTFTGVLGLQVWLCFLTPINR